MAVNNPGSVVSAQDALQADTEQQRVGKRFQWSLYDTNKLATGDTENQFFQVPKGQIGSGYTAAKSLAQTNNRGAGTILKGQAFEAHAIVPYIYAAGAAINNATYLAIQTWMRQAVLRVSFPGGDDLIQETLDHVFGEQRGWLHVPTAAGDNIFPAQFITPPGYLKLNDKLRFGALDSFEIRIANQTAVAAALNTFEVKLRLVGFLKRLNS